MGYDVFISHSSKDKAVADAVCTFLESHGIRCWIAPRNIMPGKDWSEAIVEGIAASKVLVFLFSAQSNESVQVRREVQRAFERKLHVVPIRLEEVLPGPALEYYISSIHWMNAVSGLTDAVLQELYERLAPILPATDEGVERAVGTVSELRTVTTKEVVPPPPFPGHEDHEETTVSAETVTGPPKHNLPLSATSFVGREQELEDIERLLQTVRLLTMAGLGGCGKTRLAFKAASNVLELFPDGVWLVELAPLSDENLVAPTVAGVCGVREVPGEPILQTLRNTLTNRQLLIVLDNCEHLLAACARLADALIRSCHHVRILATSREAMNIQGEQVYRVPPLTLPDPRIPQTPTTLMQFAAVRLFVERATTVQPNFALTEANARAVASVCARLDGIPLAIELAAARVKSLTVEEIDRRLDQLFRLLTGGSRTALPRQQTLRALFDWSYGLLTDPERLLLHRLTLFAGGWPLEAAEAVGAGGEVEDWEVLDLLTSLVDKSLVVAETTRGETRYRMLETVRQYGREKLFESGEEKEVRDRHRDWFVALAEEAEPNLRSAEQGNWLHRLEQEHDNLRAALAHCQETGEGAEVALRLTGALWWFWLIHGHLSEGREHLATALAHPRAQAPTAARAKALNGEGMLSWNQGDYGAARDFMEQALAINRQIGNRFGEANNLDGLGLVTRGQGDYAAARSYQEQALAINREIGAQAGEASNLGNLGLIAWNQSDFPAARNFMAQALAINRRTGDRSGEAANLFGLGLIERNQGNYEKARTFFEEALAISEEIGSRDRTAANLNGLGMLMMDQGDYDSAREYKVRSLSINRETGNRMGEALNLHYLGLLSRHREDWADARSLLTESMDIHCEIGNRIGEALNLYGLGWVAIDEGDESRAGQFLARALLLFRDLGQNLMVTETLEAFAALALLSQKHDRAARLYAAATARRDTLGAPVAPHLRTRHDRHEDELRAVLGRTGFATALIEGERMTAEEAIAFALDGSEVIRAAK